MWKHQLAFQPGEGPRRGLLRDCKNFADGSFTALVSGDRELYTSLGPRGAAWLAP